MNDSCRRGRFGEKAPPWLDGRGSNHIPMEVALLRALLKWADSGTRSMALAALQIRQNSKADIGHNVVRVAYCVEIVPGHTQLDRGAHLWPSWRQKQLSD